jgi:hypothetical protein
MSYDFSTLSPADFEDVSRELVGKELHIRFEAFCAGPDGGIDGRHAKGKKETILQAKHYVGSRFSALKSTMKSERASIDKLAPERYLLTTSCKFIVKNKHELAKIVGPAPKSEEDIFGPSDLNALLRKFPDIERAYIKLWLSSSAISERVIRSPVYSYTAISRAEIEAKVRVYAQNPSFKEARDKLETNHVLIISGPPGVGKTTLGEMLSYAYVGDEWEFFAIRSLEDGFATIVDAKKQIFLFDDFLGKVALDTRTLASKDSELARFIRRIRSTSNARFILTTRGYIFEEARRVSEHLADRRLDVTKYVLDVGVYTRRIKARILYNHLFVSNIPLRHIQNLLDSAALPKIIGHENYNPRIVEWMTDYLSIETTPVEKYAEAFLSALDNPSQIWGTAFRTHMPVKCRHLLFGLFFCSEYGVARDDLKVVFDALHPELCRKYVHAYASDDFSEAVRILEGSFIEINGSQISFINPSIRDYLTNYLKDPLFLFNLVSGAKTTKWAMELWEYHKKMGARRDDARFASLFAPVAHELKEIPLWQPSEDDPSRLRHVELPLSARLKLMLEWWDASHNEQFEIAMQELVQERPKEFNSWLDGENLVRLILSIRQRAENFSEVDALCLKLETILIEVLESYIAPG